MANRTRKVRTRSNNDLLLSERYLLETGNCWPDKRIHRIKDWREIGERWTRPYHLISPAGRAELGLLWERHKALILREWKGPGRPWAEKEFGK